MKNNQHPNSQQKKSKFPVGMIIILCLIGFGIFTLLLSTIKRPMLAIGLFTISGYSAIFYSFIIITILGLIFYGILKRKIWARKLIIIWYLLSIAIIWINYITFLANKEKTINFYKSYYPANANLFTEKYIMISSLMSLISGSIIGLIIIIYIYRSKKFFKIN